MIFKDSHYYLIDFLRSLPLDPIVCDDVLTRRFCTLQNSLNNAENEPLIDDTRARSVTDDGIVTSSAGADIVHSDKAISFYRALWIPVRAHTHTHCSDGC